MFKDHYSRVQGFSFPIAGSSPKFQLRKEGLGWHCCWTGVQQFFDFHLCLSLLKAAFPWPISVVISLNVYPVFLIIFPRYLNSTTCSICSFPHLIRSGESVVKIILVSLEFILRPCWLAFLLWPCLEVLAEVVCTIVALWCHLHSLGHHLSLWQKVG